MTENQKLREALQKAKDALSLALSDVDWRKDSPTQPVIHKAYNCAHQALALPTAEQVDDINVAESFTSVTKTAAPAQGEPFGYFRAEPFGWTDCPEDADGAIALYEHPAKPAQEVGLMGAAGLSMLIAGALFDFGGYLTTHPDVIDVGSTALAGPVADRIKAFAAMRGLSLDDAAVLSWSEGIAALRAKGGK